MMVLYRANWVKVNGTKYEVSCVLIVGKTSDEELQFGEVTRILVDITSVYFKFKLLDSNFINHHHCYCLSSSSDKLLYTIHHSQLLNYHPYGMYYSRTISSDSNRKYAVLRNIII